MKHFALVIVLSASAGCCASPPRLDPKKVAAIEDSVASVGSLAILWAPPAYLEKTRAAVATNNADLRDMLK